MSVEGNERAKSPVKASDSGIKIRTLTELRQDTTEKAQKALENRIAYFESKREIPMQDRFETLIAKGISIITELSQSIQKILPEETTKKFKEYWEKLMLAF